MKKAKGKQYEAGKIKQKSAEDPIDTSQELCTYMQTFPEKSIEQLEWEEEYG